MERLKKFLKIYREIISSFKPMIGAFFTLVLSLLSTNYNKLVGNNWSTSKGLIATIFNIVTNQINPKNGQVFFPFIYALFVFILINNLIGLIPYSFATLKSHVALTFLFSFTGVLGVIILRFKKHGLKFFSLLVPASHPLPLLPLLVFIELISYFARNISLGLRLAANITWM